MKLYNTAFPALKLNLLILLLWITQSGLQAQVVFVQPGFGFEYIGNSNLDGDVADIETVENEDYICTVARVQNPPDNRQYLLIRTRIKVNGFESFRAIDLGNFSGINPLLSVELSHDETQAVIATTDDDVELEGILLLNWSIAGNSITNQARVTWNAAITGFDGLELQRRFTASGGGVGYTVAVGGFRNGSRAILASELSNTLNVNSTVIANVDATLNSSDSNDQFMIMTGRSTNAARIKVVRYNSDANSFDWDMEYIVFSPQRLRDPHIAYNINPSTTNRNGFFIGMTEFNTNGMLRPVVFRARNNGNMVWNKILEEDTEIRGIFNTGSNCVALSTSPNSAAGVDEYKKYELTAAAGSVVASTSFTAAIDNYFDVGVKLQKGWQDRALIVGASSNEPSDWLLYKASAGGILTGPSFTCPGSQNFPTATRSIFRNEVQRSELSVQRDMEFPQYFPAPQTSFDFNCSTSKTEAPSRVEADLAAETRLYPNPVSSQQPAFSIELQRVDAGQVEVLVLNAVGQTVHHESVGLTAGANVLRIAPAKLPAGVYFVRMIEGGEMRFQQRLVAH